MNNEPKLLLREQLLEKLRETAEWDLIVIGGGATGLGTALDAASRGMRTLLLEANDFAQGTSSRSTKLIHGGVRYLTQMNISLVREALLERGLMLRNAPKELVNSLGFVIPAYRWHEIPFYAAGLKLYDALARKQKLAPSRMLTRAEVLRLIPTVARNDAAGRTLKGGVQYFDGQFDDARLAISLMRTAFAQGALALNYCPVIGLLKQQGKIAGVTARDAETGEVFKLNARAVINATGVWVDALREFDSARTAPIVSPSQGAHIVLDRDFLPGDQAILVPRTSDGRVLFCIPWLGKTLIGTTDTTRSALPLDPLPLDEEIDFILATAGQVLTRKPTRSDIRAQFAGLRPLVKAADDVPTAQLSREHTILVSSSNLITITGGKWTTYRKMAEEVVDLAMATANITHVPSRTDKLPLLPLRYGDDASACLHPDFPYTENDVRNAYRFELARQVDDVLLRRTRMGFLDTNATDAVRPRVQQLLDACRTKPSMNLTQSKIKKL